ncbi:hypothetical protein V9T40_014355 [Parthenolecanium corni]|uniref:Uncharacterized protein n=1 Tax=Parthenolecanium corni TaxID=536013 RepID=A0AAN9TG79_9HEMI
MFYEIKEKRVQTGSHAKWWLTAAFSAVVVTATFIAFVFWLGIAVRQPEPNFPERYPAAPPPPTREFQQYKTPKPLSLTTPRVEYPTAEILKTTIKNKKGRIEMVEVNGAVGAPDEKASTSKITLEQLTSTSSTTQEPALVHIGLEDAASYDEDLSPDAQLRSKISKLVAAQQKRLSEGISPLEESAVSNGENSVKKKSEAVLPGWYDPSLQSQPSLLSEEVKTTDPPNQLRQDSVYELPDFSQIKPDLSAFNTKTIPAFTYLKEPLPQFEDLTDPSADISDEEDTNDDTYYYQQQQNLDVQQSTPHRTQYHRKEAADNTLMSFLQKRLSTIQEWLLYGGKKNRTVDILDLVKALNNSFQTKNVGLFINKLKDLYTSFNSSDIQNMPVSNLLYPTSPSVLNNSTSLVSFGLLAIDLFLLHNVQQIVWNEEAKIGEEMLKDPDVVALNALFMSPDRIQQLKQTNSRIFTDREKKGIVHDLIEFINGGLRAVLNLSKAYKSSTSKSNARSTSSGSTLDCIWTLYCRNLDKTAKLHGPYGFLAKMNRYVIYSLFNIYLI